MASQYVPMAELLNSDCFEFPQYLDDVRFDYKGIHFHVFGVLHGLTGGTNSSYKEFVNKTITHAPGLRLGEMGFRRIYKGLHGELDDWMPIRARDAFRFSFALYLTPLRIARLIRACFRERRTNRDRFGMANVKRLQDIGGSPAFHAIAPDERRRFAGFPDPERYLKENIARRHGRGTMQAPIFPDKDWAWFTLVEPFANIPLRSVHMLEYAVGLAQKANTPDVSLFVGEIHNSDMAWHAGAGIGSELNSNPIVSAVAARAVEHANNPRLRSTCMRRFRFKAATAAGAIIPTFVCMSFAVLLVQSALSLL
ncbi:hypothetical protein [Paraburkholderia sp. GAS32]|uniref:hypothetical protein n=1 Tax=Paraburkholderia sp. GAS32 TaxID=3035129 RepID=UPI003D247683